MPFTTGTAATPTILMNALNTHLVANSWTKLRGETTMSTDSPISARYWRVLVTESVSTTSDFRTISQMQLRTTVGGANVATTAANFSFSSLGSGTAANLIDGDPLTTVVSADINDDSWWVKYDFGSPTIVRQLMLGMNTASNLTSAPRDFYFQWSFDNVTWTTMDQQTLLTWADNEVKLFSYPDTTRWNQHAGLNQPRRSGLQSVITGFDQQSEDTWIWQGPGYDAARRVYFSMSTKYDLVSSTAWLEMTGFTAYDANIPGLGTGQAGANVLTVKHAMGPGPVDYWIYSNSLRVILITKTGVTNYHSTYMGFLAAFALPDEYPFPFLMSSTQSDFKTEGIVNAAVTSMADPGDAGAYVRRFDNVWREVQNRRSVASVPDQYTSNPQAWTWPYHVGTNGGSSWPTSMLGSTSGGGIHWMDQMVHTDQNDFPLISCVVVDHEFGNLGALDGVFVVPGGGVVTPQQLVTISAQNYRIFPNIQRRDGNDWFAVRED